MSLSFITKKGQIQNDDVIKNLQHKLKMTNDSLQIIKDVLHNDNNNNDVKEEEALNESKQILQRIDNIIDELNDSKHSIDSKQFINKIIKQLQTLKNISCSIHNALKNNKTLALDDKMEDFEKILNELSDTLRNEQLSNLKRLYTLKIAETEELQNKLSHNMSKMDLIDNNANIIWCALNGIEKLIKSNKTDIDDIERHCKTIEKSLETVQYIISDETKRNIMNELRQEMKDEIHKIQNTMFQKLLDAEFEYEEEIEQILKEKDELKQKLAFYEKSENLLKIGDKVKLTNDRIGTVQFIGTTHFNKDEEIIGIELNKWSPNGHNGKVEGKKYFRAAPGCGIFATRNSIIQRITMQEKIEFDDDIKIGAYVRLLCGKTGYIRYIGSVGNMDELIGIELDSISYKGHDGKGYFKCDKGRGYFIKRRDIICVISQNENNNNNENVKYCVGDIVRLTKDRIGTITYIGKVHFAEDHRIGIDLDKWYPTAHDGRVGKFRYFSTKKNHGIFVKQSGIIEKLECSQQNKIESETTERFEKLEDDTIRPRTKSVHEITWNNFNEENEENIKDLEKKEREVLEDEMKDTASPKTKIDSERLKQIIKNLKLTDIVISDEPKKGHVKSEDLNHAKTPKIRMNATHLAIRNAGFDAINGDYEWFMQSAKWCLFAVNGSYSIGNGVSVQDVYSELTKLEKLKFKWNDEIKKCWIIGDIDGSIIYYAAPQIDDEYIPNNKDLWISVHGALPPPDITDQEPIEKTKNDGSIPLWIAASKGNIECMQTLIKHGADINIPDSSQGVTPLFIASENGEKEAVNILLKANADVNKPRLDDDATPIIIAAHNGHSEIIHALLEYDADPIQINSKGLNAFNTAVMQGHLGIVKLIYQHLLNTKDSQEIVDCVNGGVTQSGYTPLHLAAIGGHEDVIKYLIHTVKVDVSKKDNKNKTCSQVARQNGHKDIAMLLSRYEYGIVSVEHIRTKITEIISKYEPEKLDLVSTLMKKWNGKEKNLLKTLCEKYNEKYIKMKPIRIKKIYSIGSKIGRGAFAVVRKCKRRQDGNTFAMKVINKKNIDDLNILETEINIMRALSHPNIVKLHNVFDGPSKMCLVLDLLKGGELFDYIIEKGKFSEKDAATLFIQICQALQYMHQKSIVHRDLKPENILFITKQNSVIKIIDFGLAAWCKNGDLDQSCGTPNYVAPEILHKKKYDTQADMWSIGVVLYIMLCGFPPFYDLCNDIGRLYRKIKNGEYDFPKPYWDNISDDAKDLIRKLLEPNPKKRFTASMVLWHPWLKGNVSDKELGVQHLYHIKRFQYIRRLRRGVRCILAVLRLIETLQMKDEK